MSFYEDVTAESLDAAAQRLLGQDEPPPPEEPEEEEPDAGGPAEGPEQDPETPEGPESEPEGDEGTPEEQPPSARSEDFGGYRFDDLGVTVDESTARIYAETDYRLRNDPAFLEAFQRALGLGGQPSAVETPPSAPEPAPDPYEDPQGFVAWVSTQAETQARQKLLEELGPLQGRVEAHERFIADQNRTTATRIVESVVASFKEDKGLTDDDIKEIRGIAQIRAGASNDPYHQVKDAFEVAYWSIPRFREKALSDERAQWESDRKRQRKLAAVGGTSGSVSRTPPEPRNDAERKEGFRAAVAELFRGNSVNE